MYTHKLIVRKPGDVDKAGNVTTVEYLCRQQDCSVKWTVKLDFTTTTNYRCYYAKFHSNIQIDGDPNSNTSASIARRLRTISDF
jgi:hypothetical protein